MKGITLNIDDNTISGYLDNGIVDILVSNKEFCYKLKFSGMDNDKATYLWHSVDLQLGDSFTICYDILSPSSLSIPIKNDSNCNVSTDEDDRISLEQYYKLKQELLDEGLISE